MAVGGFLLRRLLLVAALLPLALCSQEEVEEHSEAEGGGQQNENADLNANEQQGGGNNTSNFTNSAVDNNNNIQTTGTEGSEDTMVNNQDPTGNYSIDSNSTSKTENCPAECEDWKFEVLAECEQKLMGFDNLCYYYQYKCNKPEAGCRFQCCLYPGTDVATASKFDCDDICRL